MYNVMFQNIQYAGRTYFVPLGRIKTNISRDIGLFNGYFYVKEWTFKVMLLRYYLASLHKNITHDFKSPFINIEITCYDTSKTKFPSTLGQKSKKI